MQAAATAARRSEQSRRRARLQSPAQLGSALSAFALLPCVVIAGVLNAALPEPYMDELFHVGQARAYCDGAYTRWDPKLTTLPGLYVLSVAWAHAMAAVSRALAFLLPIDPVGVSAASLLCAPAALRFGNVLLSGALLWLCAQLVHRIHPLLAVERRAPFRTAAATSTAGGHGGGSLSLVWALKSLECWLLPISFFFYFLYYTDTGSTVFVLLALQRALAQRHVQAALALAVAILYRQTNVLWCVFVCGYSALIDFQRSQTTPAEDDTPLAAVDAVTARYRPWRLAHLPGALAEFARFVVRQFPRLLRRYWAYAAVAGGFVGFVVWNGGVVVGDREHHASRWHTPQLAYFFAFAALMFGFKGAQPRKVWAFVSDMARAPLPWGACTALLCVAIATQTDPAHPFLLADNRHVPFYLWKNVLRRGPWVRYALVPLYQYGLWLVLRVFTPADPSAASRALLAEAVATAAERRRVLARAPHADAAAAAAAAAGDADSDPLEGVYEEGDALRDTTERDPCRPFDPRNFLFALLFVACTAGATVLSPLLECRYFLLPTLLLLLHDTEHLPHPSAALAAAGLVPPTVAAAATVAAATTTTPAPVSEAAEDVAAAAGADAHALARRAQAAAIARGPVDQSGVRVLFLNVALFVAINAVLLYVFVRRPFAWPDGSTARFMW